LRNKVVIFVWSNNNFCICECRYIAIVRVPEVFNRAHSQSTTAYRWNDVMILISKWRFTEWWNHWAMVKQRKICEFTIKIIHQTQSKQRHFTSLNMANVDSAFLGSIWRVSSFNTQWKRNDLQFLTRKLLTNAIENTIMKLWK
jgi:hypothetical protein